MVCPWCHAENLDERPSCESCGQLQAGPGLVLAGRYEIRELLGKGGMGLVFLAHDRILEDDVALKILRPDAITPELSRRFRAEIRLARRVSHRSVCRIHEYGEDGPWRFISMAFVDGVDLRCRLRREGPVPPAEAYEIAIEVTRALEAVHEQGIVHRDLKSTNIMLDRRGGVKLMDFGIAKSLEAVGVGTTATGMIVGTPEYMSPEQARGERLDTRSDIYSLGVVVFEMFTGHLPFHAQTPVALLMKIVSEAPPLEGAAAAGLPAALVPVLRQALAKDPGDRFASAGELALALEEARGGPPARLATPVSFPAFTPVPGSTQPMLLVPMWGLLVLAGVTLAVAAVLMVVLLQYRPRPQPATVAAQVVTPAEVVTPTPRSVVSPTPTAAPEPSLAPSVAPVPTPRVVPRLPPAAAVVSTPRPPPVPVATSARPPLTFVSSATLRVLVVPWGEVAVDGAAIPAAARVTLAAGSHLVVVRHPDYEAVHRRVTVSAGEVRTLVVDLPEEAVPKKR